LAIFSGISMNRSGTREHQREKGQQQFLMTEGKKAKRGSRGVNRELTR
jgi:hypothetical protein